MADIHKSAVITKRADINKSAIIKNDLISVHQL